ncbi:CBS domain-containing protein [Sorangium sp. So ce1036]|uniref:CBS domain-containing protein n=1 Tax=Sorangium sp. So ce1036 TaxID=3133328 RepID=UPI003F0731BE
MITPGSINGQHPIPRHTIHSARVVGRDGEASVVETVHCPVKGRSTTVRECEACHRFHALHFDVGTQTTSVVCHTEAVARAPGGAAREEPPRDPGGLMDPESPLADIMTRDVVCVRPEVAVDEVAALLVRHEINGIPVVDAEGRPVGMVSRADVLRAAEERGDTAEAERVTARPDERAPLDLEPGFHVLEPVTTTAGDVMTPVVVTLHESASIRQAAALMAYEGVHRLPVLSDDGKVVGIVSSLDVLRWFGRRCGYLIPEARRRLATPARAAGG